MVYISGLDVSACVIACVIVGWSVHGLACLFVVPSLGVPQGHRACIPEGFRQYMETYMYL